MTEPTKLRLPNVTLCAVDCVTTSLAARALRNSMVVCEFGDAILFCDAPQPAGVFRSVLIPRLGSRADYSRFILRDLSRFIATDYVLIVQWDGYVLEPRAWTGEFFEYDVIGARWPWHRDGMTVGNGGFSLRSRRVPEATASPAFPFQPEVNEDEQLCRLQRGRLTRECGIRFAPEPLADRFSYERSIPNRPTFGFHGLFNLWRHVEDRELIAMSHDFPAHVIRSREFAELLIQQVQLRRFALVEALYRRWREACTPEEIRSQLMQLTGDAAVVNNLLMLFGVAADPGTGNR